METIEKASKPAYEAADKIANTASQAADRVASTASQAAEALCEKGEQLKNVEQRIMKQCEGYIRENPVTSVGLAVAAGFLLSRLLSDH